MAAGRDRHEAGDVTEAGWRRFHRFAASAALGIVVVALGDIALMLVETSPAAPGTLGAAAWFDLFRHHRLLALRNLGVLNILNTLLEIPLFLALWHLHRRHDPAWSLLAVILLAVGASVYISGNTVLAMQALSDQFAAAASEARREALVAAGQALLALGEDLTPGTFMGFFLTELAGLVMAVVLLRGRRFGVATGVVGIVGFAALLVFNVAAAFVPVAYGAVLGLGGLGGVTMIVWYVLVAKRLASLAAG